MAQVYGGDDVVRAPPFETVEIDLLPLWGERRQAKVQPEAR